jgi:uncharacterized protein
MEDISNQDQKQIVLLEKILLQNKIIKKILKLTPELMIPNWYLGAGCIAQTVWNFQYGFDLEKGIKDYDLVYYDSSDLSYEAEDIFVQHGKKLFKNISGQVEIINEARVHLWYENKFGRKINPYKSVEDAIDEWPTTATGVGVRYDNGKFKVYAPYSLDDLFGLILRPNKLKITEDIYLAKVERWTKIWDKLQVIPWNS